METIFAYVTCADEEEARRIGRALIEERLAACANVLGGVVSIYRWQGAVQEDRETVLIFKTSAALAAQAAERVKALHSYDLPCIVTLPISGGNPAFLAWIAAQVS
jgi:periplasmic divalent cation tolerance protein